LDVPEVSDEERRATVEPVPESQVTRPATRRALRLIRQLREIFGDQVIEVDEVECEDDEQVPR
jgi:hypothetical protein